MRSRPPAPPPRYRQPRWVRWKWPVVVVAFLWSFVGLLTFLWLAGVLVFALFDGRSRRMTGEDFRMDLALTASICWVPVLTLMGSVGSAWAFYVMPSEPQRASSILLVTVGGTLLLIGIVTRSLATHYSGESLFLWAQGVDPSEALRQVREVRNVQRSAVFVEVARLGASHGARLGRSGAKGHVASPWREVTRTTVSGHWKLLVVLWLPAAFFLVRGAAVGFADAPAFLPAMLIAVTPSTVLWVVVTYLMARGDHRAWTARERVLTRRIAAPRRGRSRLAQAVRLLIAGEAARPGIGP